MGDVLLNKFRFFHVFSFQPLLDQKDFPARK
jgi:hypothetical protein